MRERRGDEGSRPGIQDGCFSMPMPLYCYDSGTDAGIRL